MTPRRQRIEYLRNKREFYRRLGKRNPLIRIDAELVPLVAAELAHESVVAQVAADIEWLAGVPRKETATSGRAA